MLLRCTSATGNPTEDDLHYNEPLDPATPSGDAFLVGIRIYGLAFMFSVLRTLVTPITYWRARRRAHRLPASAKGEATAEA